MKRILFLIAVVIWSFVAASPIEGQKHEKIVDKAFLTKQKDVLFLVYRINQDSEYSEFIEIAESFKIEEENYEKPQIVEEFLHIHKYEALPKGAIFSIFNEAHLKEAVALFKLFYYAKTYELFYKTAAWARQHVNEGMFLYSYSVAIVHRPDTYGIILPPIHEIYPYYFFSSDVIQKAQFYKMIYEGKDLSTSGYNGYTIMANYSSHYLNLHPEQSLDYFMEDVGMNSWYYSWHLHYPFWMDGEEFKIKNDRRGEMYYFIHQQLLARYYHERLSNGFGQIPILDISVPCEVSFTPSLKYQNGLEFPTRPKFAKLEEYYNNFGQSQDSLSKYSYGLSYLKDYIRRIIDAIDSGMIVTKGAKVMELDNEANSINILGNMIEGNQDSPNKRFYGHLEDMLRHLLGYGLHPLDYTKAAPSALEHFETSLRDPVFYQMFKRIVLKFQRYFTYIPKYSKKDLEFPGVKIMKANFDELITYFDTFYSDLSYSVFGTPQDLEKDIFKVRVGQQRLNHKPFTYKIQVKSDKDIDASVRIFLGPKYDEYHRYLNLSENRMNFVLFDHFKYKIKSGENVIKKSCYESKVYGPDKLPYRDFYDQVMDALDGKREFKVNGKQNYFYMPSRLMLPKGKPEGMPFQFLIVISEHKPQKAQKTDENIYFYPKLGNGGNFDGHSLGYPLDRHVDHDTMFDIPNIRFHDVQIFHKKVEEINGLQVSKGV